MKRGLSYLIIAILLSTISCETKQEPWKPILEETGFEYLETTLSQALAEIDTLENNLELDHDSDNYNSLINAKKALIGLKAYYVPLTVVRQLVYDADRFFYMKNNVDAEKNLKKAKKIIEHMDSFFKSDDFDKVFEELIVMIDTCRMQMDNPPDQKFKSLENLGNKINLMLVKGELELSGKNLSVE